MNFYFTSFLQLSSQILEKGFSYLSARLVMACKGFFESLYEKISEAFIGDNVGKGYDCFCDSLLDFEGVLTITPVRTLADAMELKTVSQ